MRPELTLYSLRHSFASWLAIAGVPLRTIQELLGHTDLRMTLKYAHLSPAHLTEALGVIGEVLRRHSGTTGAKIEESETEVKLSGMSWRPQRESNPCSGLERAVS